MCPELIFPYIPYLLTYPSGLSPALNSRRKNTVTGVNLKIAKQVLANKVPGDFVELGVYRGGSSAVLAMMIQDCTHKRHWAFDSFMGHPDVGP